ncbi:MAG: ABC transporter permease [Candidatus Omnitrophica bacterium]|nr:ABC transporter permease [Candidatus Omnitrophota bacterium]
MRTELFIAWRYLVTKRKEKFISLISIISILGIAIGVMALIVVFAVMTGFDRDLHDKIVRNYSDIVINNYATIDNKGFDSLLGLIAPNPHVVGISPYVQGQVLIKNDRRFFAVGLKGINPLTEPQVTRIDKYLVKGDLGTLEDGCVIVGKELALSLGLRIDSKLTLLSPQGKEYSLKVSGVFNSGMYDYDLNLVLVNIKTAQDIFAIGQQYTAVAVKLDNHYLAPLIKKELEQVLGLDYGLKTWMEANQNFFAALKLEKLTMFIILTLIILVASFNIISTLIVMVVEKTKDIGILKALGMRHGDIRKIFTLFGMIVGSTGITLGALGGSGLCALLKKYQFIKLPQDIYYIDRLPVAIEFWPDIFLIISSAMLIVFIATVYPAAKASSLRPVEALRYE